MKTISRYIPYFYFILAGLLLINSIQESLEEKDEYPILFSYSTESSLTYLIVRVVMIVLIVLAGIVRLNQLRK